MNSTTVDAVDGSVELFDTLVSEMQTNVTVNNTTMKINGQLNFIEGGIAETGPLAEDGYFLALEFDDFPEGATYSDVKVGLYPSYGTGLVSLDSDKNGVWKIHDTEQKFAVQCTLDGETSIKYYDLSGLSLVD